MSYIIVIDQSTSGTKAALMDEGVQLVRSLRLPHKQYYPAPGHVEHDAEEIWQNTEKLLSELAATVDPRDIAGIGIANQRETVVIWERVSGKPVHRAMVWQDVRAESIMSMFNHGEQSVWERTGLKLSPYYSAAKAAAFFLENSDFHEAAYRGELCVGTIDSYLLYRLTDGKSYKTDYSNASRTQLFNITKLNWDEELCSLFNIPMCCLPQVCDSDSLFGTVASVKGLEGVPVVAMLGDSSASFYGHGCIEQGMTKSSYGTGSSVMMNIGRSPMLSNNGLSTSVAFSQGGVPSYILEGNIICSADTLVWLKDSLQLVSTMESFYEAATVTDTQGVYLVPAFAGLGAPWFDENARAILYGMNRGTTRAHVLRAALASIAHQNADVLEAMERDSGKKPVMLRVDGGGSINSLLMQMQSDYIDCPVAAAKEKELTLRGITLLAGEKLSMFDAKQFKAEYTRVYEPQMSAAERKAERSGWIDAIYRTKGVMTMEKKL